MHIYILVLFIIMPDQEKAKKIVSIANKVFMYYDAFLTVLCFILCLVFVKNMCPSLMFLIYVALYASQTGLHYLIYKFPMIDINKHYVAYRRTVIFLCMLIVSYMFMCVTFWQRTDYHPVFCTLCTQMGLGSWVGLILFLHCIFLIGWGITLIHSYVTRRYYLLALGGFQVEQRLIQQRARQLNQMLIRQPDTNPYSFSIGNKQKYYKFQDAAEIDENKYDCSICLNKKVEDDHFVNAGCGHYFHQVCLIQWSQVNSNCPQCRHKFQEQNINKQQEEIKKQNQLSQILEENAEQQEKQDRIEEEKDNIQTKQSSPTIASTKPRSYSIQPLSLSHQ